MEQHGLVTKLTMQTQTPRTYLFQQLQPEQSDGTALVDNDPGPQQQT